jgi:hypothetical protein
MICIRGIFMYSFYIGAKFDETPMVHPTTASKRFRPTRKRARVPGGATSRGKAQTYCGFRYAAHGAGDPYATLR